MKVQLRQQRARKRRKNWKYRVVCSIFFDLTTLEISEATTKPFLSPSVKEMSTGSPITHHTLKYTNCKSPRSHEKRKRKKSIREMIFCFVFCKIWKWILHSLRLLRFRDPVWVCLIMLIDFLAFGLRCCLFSGVYLHVTSRGVLKFWPHFFYFLNTSFQFIDFSKLY